MASVRLEEGTAGKGSAHALGAGGPLGPAEAKLLLYYLLVLTVLTYYARFMPGPFLPIVLVKDFHQAESMVGLVTAAFPIASLVATPTATRLASQAESIFDFHFVALLGVAASNGIFASMPLLKATLGLDLAVLLVTAFRVVQGFAFAAYLAANTTLIMRLFPRDIPYILALTEVAVGVGCNLGRLFGGLAYDWGGIGLPFYSIAIIQVAWTLLGYRFRASTRSLSSPAAAKAPMLPSEPRQVSWLLLLMRRVVLGMAAVMLCFFQSGFYDATLGPYLVSSLKLDNTRLVSYFYALRSTNYLVVSFICALLLKRQMASFEILICVGALLAWLGLLLVPSQAWVLQALRAVAGLNDTSAELPFNWLIMLYGVGISIGGCGSCEGRPGVESSSSGMSTHAVALKEFGALAFTERMSVDPKKSSVSFILQNTECQHHFDFVQAVVDTFNDKRTHRHVTGSWAQHQQVSVLWSSLALVRRCRPQGGVMENVMGLATSDNHDTLSPLEMLLQELHALEYSTYVQEMNLDLFHNAVRRRIYILFIRKESGGEDAIKLAQSVLTTTLDAVGEYEPVPIENLIMDPKPEGFAAKMRKMKALFMSMISLGEASGPFLGGCLVEKLGYSQATIPAAPLCLAVMVSALLLKNGKLDAERHRLADSHDRAGANEDVVRVHTATNFSCENSLARQIVETRLEEGSGESEVSSAPATIFRRAYSPPPSKRTTRRGSPDARPRTAFRWAFAPRVQAVLQANLWPTRRLTDPLLSKPLLVQVLERH